MTQELSAQESACDWCKDHWGLSWQINLRALADAPGAGGSQPNRGFETTMSMRKIEIAKIETEQRG